ncbi:hypothetical protein HDU97_002215 [Phlyctochytrium planicorne]|nr:hypothetical protein HDU97_002215 [Phlyctochytrium planicorne]
MLALVVALLVLVQVCHANNHERFNLQDAFDSQTPLFASHAKDTPVLPSEWEVLGPFAIGARELGTDPLSAYGGFENLPYSESDKYPSELADGGFVRWTKIRTNADQSVGPVWHASVRWEFNQDPFGWTSLHHATYFRGVFYVPKSGIYLASFDHVVSFKIDNRAFIGNVYAYTHSSYSAVFLDEGYHNIYVCAVMDVRLFGGALPPKVLFSGKFVPVDLEGPHRGIVVFPDDSIAPEILDGRLVTPFFSVTVMNANITGQGLPPKATGSFANSTVGDVDEMSKEKPGILTNIEQTEQGWVQILDVSGVADDGSKVDAGIPIIFSVKLGPGQVYPLPVEVHLDPSGKKVPEYIDLELQMIDLDSLRPFNVPAGRFHLKKRKWGDVYKLTFIDYDGSVQYAMARPPKKPCSLGPKPSCPVVLALHGGFDWHGPSYRNVESALVYLSHMHGVPIDLQQGYAIDENRLVYTGHSNGGQGAWWMTSHYPDKALAAIPASGYLKIQFYTPYYMRVGDAYADPLFRGLMESSIAENDIDMYAANMAGVPILARTGGNDDNVPPLNTRRLVRLVNEWNRNPTSVGISEVPGQGHWFEGVVSDDTLQKFLEDHIDITKNPGLPHPPLPEAFTISTLNPASTGSKGSIKILQLEVPYRFVPKSIRILTTLSLATIRVHRNGNHWMLNTTNVRRFGWAKDERVKIDSWSIDGTDFPEPPKIGPSYLREDGETEWKVATDLLWISVERYSSTYGPASQILMHQFLIVIPSNPTVIDVAVYRKAAQNLAASWYLFGRGGTQIIRDVDVRDGLAAKYHMIVLGGPKDNVFTKRREGEVQFLESGGVQIDRKKYEAPGTGIIFLAPSPTRTLMGLFLAGTDELGFRRAVWTMPFRTGLMVPDYMVIGDEYGDPATGWTAGDGSPFGGAGTKGGGGIFAAGYWNNKWNFDTRCGYTK